MMNCRRASGSVSLFIVLFASLLLTVLTVGFMSIMIQEQVQATNQDLSQSAYDSAVSGVEDAKRALYACQSVSSPIKEQACAAIGAKKCTTIQASGVVPSQGQTETVIKSGTLDSGSLNQAYTCVTIEQQTDDYIGNLTEGKSAVIPLKSVEKFDTIQIEWMHKDNGSTGTSYAGGRVDTLAPPVSGDAVLLPVKSDWSPNAASLLRVQSIVPTGASVSLDQLDGSDVTTTFLRPSSVVTDNPNDVLASAGAFNVQIRSTRSTGVDNATTDVKSIPTCSNYRFTHGAYACRATLSLPASDMVPPDSQVAFIRLTSLYRDTSYKISLIHSGTVVKFDGVQPIVDSTGRAGNIFRRISSRVGAATNLPYPESVFDVLGSLCKDFYVTDTIASADGSCSTAPTTP